MIADAYRRANREVPTRDEIFKKYIVRKDQMRYKSELLFKDYPNYMEISKIVEESGGLYNQAIIMGEEEIGIILQLKLNQPGLEKLKKSLESINVDFDDVFYKDLRHYHLEVNYNGEDHEGIAIELEDHNWELYYVNGPLFEKFSPIDQHIYYKEHGFYITKVSDTRQAHQLLKEFIVTTLTDQT